jgi:O-antigen ligase
MRNVTRYLVFLYVFTVPWDVVGIEGAGTLTRVIGFLLIAVAVLTVVAEGRVRKPDAILGLATAFTAFSALSLLWTISFPSSVEAVWTYSQLLGSIWVIREFAETREERQRLLLAFCLGAFVPMIDLLNRYYRGLDTHDTGRYTATGLNADGVGLLLVIGIPIAWHLAVTRAGVIRVVAFIYVIAAPVAILLTGARGAFLAGLVALSIIALSLRRASVRSVSMVWALLALMIGATAWFVPQPSWDRIATIPDEITDGSMSTRRDIWAAGLEKFPEHPLLGVGAGAYGAILEQRGDRALPAHNLLLGVLVEEGIVGLFLFTALLAACIVVTVRLPALDRRLWTALLLCWLIGVMSISMERWKVTWVMFALLSAQSGAIESVVRPARRSERQRPPVAARLPLADRVHLQRTQRFVNR